jgi:hypothetical protein
MCDLLRMNSACKNLNCALAGKICEIKKRALQREIRFHIQEFCPPSV